MDKMTVPQMLADLLTDTMGVERERIHAAAAIRSLMVDSLDFLDFRFQVEQRFDLMIRDEEVHLLVTVQDLVDFIELVQRFRGLKDERPNIFRRQDEAV